LRESSLDYLRCVNCNGSLDLRIFEITDEVQEGLLQCAKCERKYPVISSVAFLLKDFPSYFSIRAELGGRLMLESKNLQIRSFIRESLQKIKKVQDDTTKLERDWVRIYRNSSKSRFYVKIKDLIKKIPRYDLALEHGCSIGNISKEMALRNGRVFGLDKSFFAVLQAKQLGTKNADFFVADSLNHPFENRKFDLVVSLNILELIDPSELLKVLSTQVGKLLILSDPYDFERGKYSVKTRTDAKALRENLVKMGFTLVQNTRQPCFVPWRLSFSSRLQLYYKVDVIVAKKRLRD